MNFKILVNDIKQQPVVALLAIIITAIGFTTTFLILVLYITDSNIDRSLSGHQSLYRIESQFNLPNGDKIRSAQVPFPLIDALQKQPEIESVGYAYRLDAKLNRQGNTISHIPIYAVTPIFMEQLHPYRNDLPAPGPHDIYITADFSHQYLGLDNPLGETIDLGESGQFTVKAIVEPRPNSSLNLQAVIAFNPAQVTGYANKRLDWYDTHVYTFVRLKPNHMNFDNSVLAQIVANYAPSLPGAPFTPSSFLNFKAKNILEMHYDDGYADEFANTRAKSLIYILYTAAAFVLFSTTANFFNINGTLNTAKRPSLHTKRSIGASNKQILLESLNILGSQCLVTTALASIFLCLLLALSPDIYNLIIHQPLTRIVAIFISVTLFVSLIMLVSHLFSLSLFLFGQQNSQAPSRYENRGVYYTNRIMMVIQLTVAGITLYLWSGMMTQNNMMADTDFGYQKTHRLTFALDEGFYSLSRIHTLRQQLKETAGALNLSLSSWQPFNMSRQIVNVQYAQQRVSDQFTSINTLSADKYFIDTWGLTTLAGQDNILEASSDSGVCYAIVTRSFLHAMGQKNFDEVLNTRYYIPLLGQQHPLQVLRVVEDFDLGEHLPSPQPLIIFINDRLEKFAALSYSNEQYRESLIALLKSDGPPNLSVQTVQALHAKHFHNDLEMLRVIILTTILSMMVMVISTLTISIAEAQRLNSTLTIMEAVGGSIATSIVFFIGLYALPILISLLAALSLGYLLLKSWLQQYQSIAEYAYINAFAALLLLGLIVIAIMALSLALRYTYGSQPQLKQN